MKKYAAYVVLAEELNDREFWAIYEGDLETATAIFENVSLPTRLELIGTNHPDDLMDGDVLRAKGF